MKIETINERLILEAAEAEFLEKGHKGAATTAIAKRAGVTPAMLHYYYRTKDNLFQKVFHEKTRMMVNSLDAVFHENSTFEDTVRSFVETHFDFIAENPKLMIFLYNEIISCEECRKYFLEQLLPKLNHIADHFQKLIDDEVSNGLIKSIKLIDLMMNIISLNLITFMALPIMKEMTPNQTNHFISERKENNVQFILSALRM